MIRSVWARFTNRKNLLVSMVVAMILALVYTIAAGYGFLKLQAMSARVDGLITGTISSLYFWMGYHSVIPVSPDVSVVINSFGQLFGDMLLPISLAFITAVDYYTSDETKGMKWMLISRDSMTKYYFSKVLITFVSGVIFIMIMLGSQYIFSQFTNWYLVKNYKIAIDKVTFDDLRILIKYSFRIICYYSLTVTQASALSFFFRKIKIIPYVLTFVVSMITSLLISGVILSTIVRNMAFYINGLVNPDDKAFWIDILLKIVSIIVLLVVKNNMEKDLV